jgi:tRNA uridine 5-carboxymethylaminomethyl modification enzyme
MQAGASPAQYVASGVPINQDGRWRSAYEVLGLAAGSAARLNDVFRWLAEVRPKVSNELVAEALYAPYLARQAESLRTLRAEEQRIVPAGLDFSTVPGLSLEMRQRLHAARPTSLGAASRVPGVTPAALAALAVHLR